MTIIGILRPYKLFRITFLNNEPDDGLNGMHILNDHNFQTGLDILAKCDSDLNLILTELGPPPLWSREPGFGTLLYIILEQQVSLASAQAAYERLLAAVSPLTPGGFLNLSDTALRAIGFSRQKSRYGRCLAQALVDDQLDLASFIQMDDAAVRTTLMNLKGIGPWTADIYLLLALGRPDIWPNRDLALSSAVQQLKQLPMRPTPEKLDEMAAAWQPWRSVAARLLWHYYLNKPKAHINKAI